MSSLLSGAKDIFIGDEQKIAKPLSTFAPVTFNTPGAGVNFNSGGFTVNRTPQVGNSLAKIARTGDAAAAEIGALKPLVAPGFGRLTQAGVAAIENQRRSTVGDLRENLQRRRVLGSSFAADDVSRTNAEFAQKEAEFRAEATLQEIQATEKLITAQYQTSIEGAKAIIDQGNFETQIGAELSRQYTQVMGELAKYEASLLRDEADGQAALLSALLSSGLGGGLSGVGAGLGGLIDGIGSTLGSIGSGVGGFLAGGASSISSGLSGLFGGAAAGGAIATALPGFNDLGSIPMTELAPDGILGGGTSASSQITSFNTAPPSTDLTAGAITPNSLFSGASGAAIAGGGIAGLMALLNGEGFQQAVAQGGGAAAGAALGFSVTGGNPIGAIIGGLGGSLLGGALGEKLGLSASGGGDDKPDYSLVTGPGLDDGRALVSQSPWGTIGFGHQKHLTNNDRYQAGLDAITETDKIIASQLTQEENEKLRQAYQNQTVARNSNEGGFNPARMMGHFFENRAETLKKTLGEARFSALGLDKVYEALKSGKTEEINAAFGGVA